MHFFFCRSFLCCSHFFEGPCCAPPPLTLLFHRLFLFFKRDGFFFELRIPFGMKKPIPVSVTMDGGKGTTGDPFARSIQGGEGIFSVCCPRFRRKCCGPRRLSAEVVHGAGVFFWSEAPSGVTGVPQPPSWPTPHPSSSCDSS